METVKAVGFGTGIGILGFILSGIFWNNWSLNFQNPVPVKFVLEVHLRTPIYLEPKNKVVIQPLPKPEIKHATPTPTIKPQAKLTDNDIIKMIKSYDWDADTMVALAKSENFWNLTKSFNCERVGKPNNNGSQDYGLFQINTIHAKTLAKWGWTMEDMKDCKKNIEFAYKHIYKGAGLTAWSAYNNGNYLAFIN